MVTTPPVTPPLITTMVEQRGAQLAVVWWSWAMVVAQKGCDNNSDPANQGTVVILRYKFRKVNITLYILYYESD